MPAENNQGNMSDVEDIFTEGAEGQQGDQNLEGGGDTNLEGGDPQAGGEGGEPQGGAAAQTPLALTSEQIQELVAGVGQQFQQNGQQTQTAPGRQPTMEDFNRMMNVYQPTAVQLKALRNAENEEEALLALNDMLQGAARQAVTMATYGQETLRKQFEEAIAPLRQHMAEVQQEKYKVEFYQQNKDLAPYEEFVTTLIDAVKQRGMKFKDKNEAFKFVAGEARTRLKKLIPTFGQAQGGTGTPQGGAPRVGQQQSQRQPRMSTLSGGGQGGVGSTQGKGGAAAKPKGPSGIEVF
jgi:hypothetical protein